MMLVMSLIKTLWLNCKQFNRDTFMIINTIIPMVEFINEESKQSYPRYLRMMGDKILLEKAVESLTSKKYQQKFYFIVSDQFERKFNISHTIKQINSNSEVILAKAQTAGSVCTVLLAIDHADNNPCIVAAHDQILKKPIDQFLNETIKEQSEAGLITFNSIHPKWSYVQLNDSNKVIRAVGNDPISRHASSGIYYFRNTREMMDKSLAFMKKFGGQKMPFLTNLILNEYILNDQKVTAYQIPNEEIELYKKDE